MQNSNHRSASGNLLDEIRKRSRSTISDSLLHATSISCEKLFAAIDRAEAWLRPDLTLGLNIIDANQQWLSEKSVEYVEHQFDTHFQLEGDQSQKSNPSDLTESLRQDDAENSEPSLSALSLVDKEDFEGWLVVNTEIKTIEKELGLELRTLYVIFDQIGEISTGSKECPIGPHQVIHGIKASVDTLEIPVQAQHILYRSIGSVLKEDLKDLYGGIIAYAEQSGLDTSLPKPASSSTSSPSSPSSHLNQSAAGIQSVVGEIVESVADNVSATGHVINQPVSGSQSSSLSGMDTLNTLSRLHTSVPGSKPLAIPGSESKFSGEAGSGESAVSDSTGHSQLFEKSQIINAVRELQQDVGVHDSNSDLSLKQLVQLNLADNVSNDYQIGEQDSELIEITDKFFDVILESIGMNGVLKNWLEKLKFTILKVVLNDDSFFSDGNHPARQLVNKLAKLDTSEKTGNKRIKKTLDHYIDRVINEYDNDKDAIPNILKDLEQVVDRQEKAYQRNAERIARSYEGKQKVSAARELVVSDVNNLIGGKDVPLVLLELLDKAGWRDLLVLNYLREGPDSDNYREVLQVVDQLMAWLGKDVDEEERWALEMEMELEAPSLQEMLNRELAASGKAGFESIMTRLNDCFFNDAEVVYVYLEEYSWPFEKNEDDLKELRPVDRTTLKRTHWHKRVLSMKMGDWIEITHEDGNKRCLRMAWSGSESYRFVFVDSQGMKDVDLSIDELVDHLREGKAELLEDAEVPLVDQGLHKMVHSVYEELSLQANCDPLTGLLNRQAFEREIDRLIADSIKTGHNYSLLYIDLDKFRITNNNYGHLAGDALLKHVAGIIRASVSENASCGRLGGNEFGIIVQQDDDTSALLIAEKVCQATMEEPLVWEDKFIESTVSIGFASFDTESDNQDSVLRKANLACLSAKEQGANRAVAYEKQGKDQKHRDEMLAWIQKIDQQLEDILTLRCQEIRPIDGDSGKLAHYEILLGVKFEGHVIPPGALIEAAEHFGRMPKVDRWVVHNVLRWMEEHPQLTASSDSFSINLSGSSLSDESFLNFVLSELSATTVSKSKICFEVTETSAISNISEASEFIKVLKQSGCKIALDDFGTGLSSYAYIQKLPVDYIKIDGVFVKNIVRNQNDQALVKSINELAHFMGIETVAEYVENDEILEVLRHIGVDHSQGFGIKRPTLLGELRQTA